MQDKEYLKAAAETVFQQLTDMPFLPGVPLDPDVADYLGAFSENAVNLSDFDDDPLLNLNEVGEVIYEG